MTMTAIESTTWLDRLPTEIIFHIFDYLSSNDIIYTFFYFSQRFNHLLLQNQRYLIHLELPTKNLNLWQTIFSHISSQIESLTIITIGLSFPLSLFPNLKSLIVFSPYGSSNENLKLIFESDQFNNLHLLKIKQHIIFYNLLRNNYLVNQDYISTKVFNNQNSLKTFHCSLIIQSLNARIIANLKTNFNLHSLTLVLTEFKDIYSLIDCTPNLNYLNITTQPCYGMHPKATKKINIKLKEFYLKLVKDIPIDDDNVFLRRINFDEIINGIKHLPLSSLICLSLDFVSIRIKWKNGFPINSIEVQQFLESMTELKQFHLYVILSRSEVYLESILETFQDQFWSDHSWSFGTHDKYFYTLPFHFDHLYLNELFNGVKSNNPEILKTNPRIWYNVRIVDLYLRSEYDLNFVKELKMKMPKLTTIQFRAPFISSSSKIQDLNEREKVQLGSVTTVHFAACQSIKAGANWLICALPNVKHVMSTDGQFLSAESELAPIFNRQIEQLNIDTNVEQLEQLAKINYVYFSNVQHIYFGFNNYKYTLESLADVVMETLKNFQKLKTLTIYRSHYFSKDTYFTSTTLNKLIECLNRNKILEKYEMKSFEEYLFFSKKTFEI